MCSNVEKPDITIGLPVYNAEKTIKKTLNSIMEQTFTNFQVIISDNNSTDNTERICQEYSKKRINITYIKQNENIGLLNNFKFVLNFTNSEYFVWVAHDDWWEPTFLEKNVAALNSNKEFVGSVSKIDFFDINKENYKQKDSILKSKIKKYYSYEKYSNCRTYHERVSFYLRIRRAENIYGLFRTTIIKKCVTKCWEKRSVAEDLKILLFIQKFGPINLLNEVLLHRSGKGLSSKHDGTIDLTKYNDFGVIGKIFPFLSFSIWILKNLGIKVFLKNLDYLFLLNGSGFKNQLKQFFKKH